MSAPSDCRKGCSDGILSSPPRKAQRTRLSRRSVRFCSSGIPIQQITPSDFSLSDDEISLLWYTKEEYSLMKKAISYTVRLMERTQVGIDDDDDELCPRGLENQTRSGSRRKLQNIEAAIDAVLIEQQRQWELNEFDDTCLARLYRSACAQASMRAWLIAQKDAKLALSYATKELNPLAKWHPSGQAARRDSVQTDGKGFSIPSL
jgi:hypothetical protein